MHTGSACCWQETQTENSTTRTNFILNSAAWAGFTHLSKRFWSTVQWYNQRLEIKDTRIRTLPFGKQLSRDYRSMSQTHSLLDNKRIQLSLFARAVLMVLWLGRMCPDSNTLAAGAMSQHPSSTPGPIFDFFFPSFLLCFSSLSIFSICSSLFF